MSNRIKKILSLFLTFAFLCGVIPAANATDVPDDATVPESVTRSYEEDLLVEYYEYTWYKTVVIYSEKYRTFRIPHSYTSTEQRERLDIPDYFPTGATDHYKVTITYDIY